MEAHPYLTSSEDEAPPAPAAPAAGAPAKAKKPRTPAQVEAHRNALRRLAEVRAEKKAAKEAAAKAAAAPSPAPAHVVNLPPPRAPMAPSPTPPGNPVHDLAHELLRAIREQAPAARSVEEEHAPRVVVRRRRVPRVVTLEEEDEEEEHVPVRAPRRTNRNVHQYAAPAPHTQRVLTGSALLDEILGL